MTPDATDPTACELIVTLARARMTAYEDGKGRWLFRESTTEALAAALLTSDWLAARESAAATRARAEALREAADALRSMAAQEFDTKGPMDARGAAIWDSASWLTERADSLAPDTAGESA